MADIGSFDTSSYPKPQPQANNPLAMVSDIAKLQSSLGDLEVGKGVQQAMGPDGQIDHNKLATFLGQSPAGASKAIPTLDALAKLKQAGFAADASGLETLQKRLALTGHLFGSIADKGDKATMADVNAAARYAISLPGAKELGIDLPLVLKMTKSFHGDDGKPLSGREIAKRALELTTQAASSSEVLSQHSPQVNVIDDGQNVNFIPGGTKSQPAMPGPVQKRIPPTTPTVVNGKPQLYGEQGPAPGGTPLPAERADPEYSNNFGGKIVSSEAGPVQRADLPDIRPTARQPYGTAKGPAVGNDPGFNTATDAEAGASAASMNALRAAAREAPETSAIIGNLEKELKNFTPGPLADYKRIAKNFATANLPLPESWKKEGAIFDTKSLASQEEFNKQVYQLVQSQFKALGGTGTDAKLDAAGHTSPNELMSQYGIKGILSLLKGQQDAIKIKAKELNKWRQQGNGPQTDAQFQEQFNNDYDPRVFQFRYLDKADRQKYFDQIEDKAERQELLRKVQIAHDNKWVAY